MNDAITRTVIACHPASRHDIGSLITRVPIPAPGLEQIDPFLLLAHHGPQVFPPRNQGLPFGPHPHRGFETVTFVLAGSLAHIDSGGNENVVGPGGVQWMTAGSGLVHAEVAPPAFKELGGDLEILQLWVNLPGRLKMTEPRYSGVPAKGIPAVELAEGAGTLRLVAGAMNGCVGPIRSITDIFMSTVHLKAGARALLPAPSNRNVFFYVVIGSGKVAGTAFDKWQLLEMDKVGNTIEVHAQTDAVILFAHGSPIGETVVASGPFVMNSQEEIHQAIRDYTAGKFEGGGKLPEI